MSNKENEVSGLVKTIIKRKTNKNQKYMYLRLIFVYSVFTLKTNVIVSSLGTIFTHKF